MMKADVSIEGWTVSSHECVSAVTCGVSAVCALLDLSGVSAMCACACVCAHARVRSPPQVLTTEDAHNQPHTSHAHRRGLCL